MTSTSSSYDQSLPTLNEDGSAPSSRVSTAAAVRNLVLLWWNADQSSRGRKRSRTTGLIQGNPPYSRAALVSAGRGDATNVNWRTAESYEENSIGAIYDIFSEAPTFATIDLDAAAEFDGQDPERSVDWGNIVTEEFDYLVRNNDPSWDCEMQNSIRETTRFGAGPLIFPDDSDWRNVWVPFGNLLVPEDAPSNINKWEVAAVLEDLLPHQLYDYISNEEAAASSHWTVEAVKKAIIHASPDAQQVGYTRGWEWVQQQLKQDSYSYSARSKVIQIVHFYAREFKRKGEAQGKITHVIVLRNPVGGTDPEQFLYKHERCYNRWQECVHPMYYSQGQGGKHYGVTGQGVKMYGALETENRLLCNMVDKAFSPKTMFKPTTASGKQKMLPQRMGDYMIMPEGYDLQQVAIHSLVEEGMAVREVISRLLSANLSTYRQNLEAPKSGNPLTKAEVEIRAGDQARLGKTQLNRYYQQLDWLYEEKYRRACNRSLTSSDSGGKEALEFQKKCKRRGVPLAALLHYCSVKATRVVGQGSQYLRQQNLDFLLAIGGSLPEDGRIRVVKDAIASRTGQYMVNRYYPERTPSALASDQQAFAMSQVADMKVGVPAVVTSSQNPIIYAQTFLQAASQALASLQQAGPGGIVEQGQQVLAFLQLAGPAIAAHLQRFASDPTRKAAHQALEQQFKSLAKATDQLAAKVQQVMQKQQEAVRKQQQEQMEAGREALAVTRGQDPALVVGLAGVERKAQIDTAKASAQAGLKARKQQVDLGLKTTKAQADIAIADAKAAAEIVNSSRGNGSESE